MLTPERISSKLERLWPRFLRARVTGSELFPLKLPLGAPSGTALVTHFTDIDSWARSIKELSISAGFELEFAQVSNRQLGLQQIPQVLVVPDSRVYLRFVRRAKAYELFERSLKETNDRFPELSDWIVENIILVDRHAESWSAFLEVLDTLRRNPRPALYIRELDIPGVDTKFIERNMGLLSKLLEALRVGEPNDAMIDARSLVGFCRRYGLKHDPPLIRFRWLDPELHHLTGGFSDLSIPLPDFASLAPPVHRVFITENKVNGLTFPEVPCSMVIFGLGFGIEVLKAVPWLSSKEVYYWGDLDTHGFAILARLRAFAPEAKSLLMDEQTLMSFESLWGSEDTMYIDQSIDLLLCGDELNVLHGLRTNRFGLNVRLEQERIPLSHLRDALLLFPALRK